MTAGNMRAWRLEAFGRGNLALREAETPAPGPGQVLVRMAAASLNYRDLLIVDGSYDPRMRLPAVPLSDGAGTVAAIGEGVTRVAVGDRVAPIFVPGWHAGDNAEGRPALGGPLPGVAAEYHLCAAEDVVRLPGHLSWAEAATLPCAAVTAWHALFGHARVRPGDRVLILGTGGAALFALQFAKLAGAEVAITSGSDAKLERARALGADHLVNYAADPRWGATVKRLFGDGADVVVELGGGGTIAQSVRAVRRGGTVLLIGSVTGGRAADLDLVPVFMRGVRLQGVSVGHRDAFTAMLRAIGHHRLRPVIDAEFPFERLPDALAHLAGGGAFGKVVVTIGD